MIGEHGGLVFREGLPGVSVMQFTAVKQVSATFDPQPDIDAFELARLLPFVLGRRMLESDWVTLGTAQRHLKRTDGGGA